MTSTMDICAAGAEQAWRNGDTAAAIEAADHVLAAGSDTDCRAAGVAAAAEAADGALLDAAERWRRIGETLDGTPGVRATGRAALTAALTGDTEAARRDLTAARAALPASAPRGLSVLLDGVAATIHAVRGDFDRAARKLAGLAVATVPADPLAVERWDDLAATVVLASQDDQRTREMLAHPDRPLTTRRRLLAAWLDLRAGRLAEARQGVAAAAGMPIMRRDAVLAAAISVGLARRAGDAGALRATWHRVAPVVAGADVELLLLDAWGELSAGAALVSPIERDLVVEAMTRAVARAGAPAWAAATGAWWRLQRAVAAANPAAAAVAADHLARLAPADHRAAAARVWAAILGGTVDPAAATGAAEALAEAGRPWEAAALCAAAAGRTSDSNAAKELLAAGRAVRARIATGDGPATNGLSKREHSVGELLLDGLTHKEIGAKLYISPKTVEQHVARLRQKLDAANRAELILALRARLNSVERNGHSHLR